MVVTGDGGKRSCWSKDKQCSIRKKGILAVNNYLDNEVQKEGKCSKKTFTQESHTFENFRYANYFNTPLDLPPLFRYESENPNSCLNI
jgi:hypothetical protein